MKLQTPSPDVIPPDGVTGTLVSIMIPLAVVQGPNGHTPLLNVDPQTGALVAGFPLPMLILAELDPNKLRLVPNPAVLVQAALAEAVVAVRLELTVRLDKLTPEAAAQYAAPDVGLSRLRIPLTD